jgi:uncharacterized repeat protein (TIGR01451 family)
LPTLVAGAKSRSLTLALLLAALSLPVGAAEWRILSLERVTPSESVQPQARGSTPGTRLRLASGTRQFDFLLEPNTGLLPGGQAGTTEALKGSLPGLPGSWARLTRRAGRYQGMYSDGAQTYIVDSAGSAARSNPQAAALDPAATVIYRVADLQVSGVVMDGDTVGIVRTGADLLGAVAADLAPATGAAVLATRRLDIGVVVDAELAALDGTNTDARVIDRLNIVDGIFSGQAGVQLRLASTTVMDAATQPFTSTASSTLLEQLGTYRRDSSRQTASGLTHLMTGRDLDGQTVGIAYIGSLCSSRFGASLSEARNSVPFDALIAAHEIGHAFGAPHDGDTATACAATADNLYLMASRLNGSSTFSDCSLQEIAKTVTASSCLAQVDAADAALSVPVSSRLALNQATTVTFTVRSVGTAAVNAVALTVTPPANVVVSGGGVTGGSCDTLQGRLNCSLGTLAAGESRDVQLSLTSSASGSSAATLQLTASNDGLAQNNRVQLSLTTAPGADLSAGLTSDAQSVTIGQSTTLQVSLRNQGLAAATDALLTATLPAGVTLQSVGSTGIRCTLNAGALDCPAAGLAVDATATVTLGLRIDQVGALPVSVNFRSALLADPQPGNNVATLNLTGTAVPPPAPTPVASSSGGGGGRLDLLALLGLALLRGLQRRPLRPRRAGQPVRK